MAHEHLKGSVEARLDRLRRRLDNNRTEAQLRSVVLGILDLLRDVLLEGKTDGKR